HLHVREIAIEVTTVPGAVGVAVVRMGAGTDARVGASGPVGRVVSRLASGSRPRAELVVVVAGRVEEVLGQAVLVGGQVVLLPPREATAPAQRTAPRRGSPLVWHQRELQGIEGEVVGLERKRRAEPGAPICEPTPRAPL